MSSGSIGAPSGVRLVAGRAHASLRNLQPSHIVVKVRRRFVSPRMQATTSDRSFGQALLLIWSALWRAQVTHLALFVLVPVVAASIRAAVGIVLLPFLLSGFGDRAYEGLTEVGHLRSPGCWVAVAPCAISDASLFALPGTTPASLPGGPGALEAEPFLPVPTEFTLRHAWFGIWLMWFAIFLIRRERRRKRSTA